MKELEKEETVILKLENDIESTDPNKSGEIDAFWSNINGLQTNGGFLTPGYKPTLSFEIVSDSGGASFYLTIPKKFQNIISKKINAVYPYIEITEVEDPLKFILEKKDNEFIHSYELQFQQHESFSLKTKGTEKTFLNNLLNSMNHFGEQETSVVQVVMRPLPEEWNEKAEKRAFNVRKKGGPTNPYLRAALYVTDMIVDALMTIADMLFTKGNMQKTFKEPQHKDNLQEKETKFNKPCFNVAIRVASKSNDNVVADQTAKSITTVFKDLDSENKLKPIKITYKPIVERLVDEKNNAMSTSEISQFALLPSRNVSADSINKGSIKMPYDKNVPHKGVEFGYLPQSNNKKVAFPMTPISLENYKTQYEKYEKIIDNICKPRLVLGQMGTGKSEWIISYTLNLIKLGVGVVLVDPKNDTQKRLIESIPEKDKDRIDYLNLGDLVFPPALNILRKRNEDDSTEQSLIVQTLISFFKKEFGRSWGFAMQQMIMMTGNAILLDEVSSLYEFQLMITNKEYRGRMISKIEELSKDESRSGKAMLKELLSFWKQFHAMSERDQMQRISSTMNKIGVFMSNRVIRAIVSQRESYDFRKAGDSGRITIVNIPDGELGDENTKLLASFINKAIWLDFRSRANIPIEQRYPTIWLIEEAHMIMDEEFIPVLTQSRGYRLGVTILTQGLNNFKNKGMDELKDLILTNCKNKIIFRVGPQDARVLAEEFAPLTQYDLMNCPDYHFYSKMLLEDGKVSDVFFARSPDMAEELRNYDEYKSKHRSGRLTIDEIEDQLDERHKLEEHTIILNVGEEQVEHVEEKPKRQKRAVLEFME